ncbi:Teichoic acid translocation permease protein tagG, partial [Listeria aquatica FSL S10-1188]
GQTVIHSDIPYIYWMLIGLIPWFYMSSSIVSGAGSICQNLGLIAKTHFPIEILPTIAVVKGLNSFFFYARFISYIFYQSRFFSYI